MGDEVGEDFSQLPLADQFTHKNWKARKGGYEAASKAFDTAQSEDDAIVRQFISDSGIWKGVVSDSNVAAQQEGLGALCSFLNIAGKDGCTRTRKDTIAPICEKGLLGRPAAKQKAQEAIMLYIELDKADPIIEELIPLLSHKQPKVIAATLSALSIAYHAYGCKTMDPKPVLKVLPKAYGHADKNVRAAAQELTVEFYRWLKESMKPMFWNDLKPMQQQDLDKLFEKVKGEPTPKQERLLRSQQAAPPPAAAAAGGGGGDEDYDEEIEEEMEDLEMAIDVSSKIPKDFEERLGSSKWKDRKDALDDLFAAINVPKMEEGQFDYVIRGLAKSMKDANIAVVIVAANCIEAFGRGLRRSFAKHRSTVMSPMMERLKEKKQTVADALGAALDAVFAATGLSECLEEILECLKHKNPQVKLESTKFLIRCLRTTKDAPALPEVKSIADASTKLLTESQAVQREAGAEVIGTLWKIMGDRIMAAHLEGLDEIRKTKIKEFHDAAEVKAKHKPKAAPPPKPAPAPAARKGAPGKKPAAKRPAPAVAAPPPEEQPLAPKATSRPGASKLGAPKSGLAAPSGLRGPGGAKKGLPQPGMSTPKRQGIVGAPSPRMASPEEEPAAPPAPKFGLGRGLAGRPLGKPGASAEAALAPAAPPGMSAIERAELDELRVEVERLRKQAEDWRGERTRLSSQIHELQMQNAQLIEDHTRDVLSIKAKETQLVRARSDAEAAEQMVQTQQRENDRLKRELSRQVRATSPPPFDASEQIMIDSAMNGSSAGRYGDGAYSGGGAPGMYHRASRSYGHGHPASPGGEGKENYGDGRSSKLSPLRGSGSGMKPTSSLSSGSGGGRASPADFGPSGGSGSGESWKRAAEVTQNLKARIELMKAKQAARAAGQ